MKNKDNTKVVHCGRSPSEHFGAMNVPIYQVSSIKFPNVKEFEESLDVPVAETVTYGMHGSPTTYALEDLICDIEGGYRTRLCGSGLTAVIAPLLLFLSAGDHVLITDSAYTPTKCFCDTLLKRMGIEVTFYEPLIGADIEKLVKANTKVIFLESPGSWIMEVQDIPAIVGVAKKHGIITMIDNTWASPMYFKPFGYGIDLSIQAATKYISGHSDLMLGSVTSNEECYPKVREGWHNLGLCASPQDAFMTARGMRTMGLRMKRHWDSALKVAAWLYDRPEVSKVLYPPFSYSPGHDIWKRDFLGGTGLLTFALKKEFSDPANPGRLADNLEYFSIGHSWGGCESMIVPCRSLLRRSTNRDLFDQLEGCHLIRLHIGLEDVDDLIDDLSKGFLSMKKV